MDTLSTFATRFKKLREERGFSQSDLAKELNISRGSVSFYENGSRSPDIKVLTDICNYFHVTSDYMIGLSDNKTIESSNIGVEIGLADEAINVLKSKKNNKFYTIVLSYLITQKKCLSVLVGFLACFVIEEFYNSKYSIFSLKEEAKPLTYYKDIYFSRLIRALPKYSDEMEQYFTKEDTAGLNYLILEYASQKIDIAQMKRNVDIVDDFDDIYFDYDEEDNEEFENHEITDEEMQKYEEKAFRYAEQRVLIAEELLSYIKQKRGEPNGDSTKEG